MANKKPQAEEKQEQPAKPDVQRGDDDGDDSSYDDEDEDCFPCLACWQIIALAVLGTCIMIGIVVTVIVLFVGGGGSDGSSSGVDFPPDTFFKVQVQNQYSHGTVGVGTHDLIFNLQEGQSYEQDAGTTTDIKAYLSSEKAGVANLEVTVKINFNLDSKVDCNDTFYTSVEIDSGSFGEWTSQQSCTYTSGGIYVHSVRVKVDALQ